MISNFNLAEWQRERTAVMTARMWLMACEQSRHFKWLLSVWGECVMTREAFTRLSPEAVALLALPDDAESEKGGGS